MRPPAPQPLSRSALRAVLLLFCLLAPQATSAQLKVAVVGAGTAGLSAARQILDHYAAVSSESEKCSISDVEIVVFEGRDRIGGRIWTKTAAEVGLPNLDSASAAKRSQFDMGASWIHGSSEKHPLTKFRDALGLASTKTEDTSKVWVCGSGQTDACPQASDWKEDEIEDLFTQAFVKAINAPSDISLWDALEGLSSNGATRETPMVASEIAGGEFGPPADEVTLRVNIGENWDNFGGTQEEVILTNGYVQLPQALKDGTVSFDRNPNLSEIAVTKVSSPKALDVRLSQKVTKVTHGSSGVTLEGADFSYEADYAIVTVPLGVLKAGTITFSPAIDGAQKQAIDRIGFGNGVKVWVRFESDWWTASAGASTYWLSLAQHPNRGLFTGWLNGKATMDEPVLLCFVGASDADQVDSMTDSEMWTRIRENFVKMFGSSVVPSNYTALYKSNWKNDEFSLGIYSFPKVGSEDSDYSQLDKAIGTSGRLYMAGEHTSREHPSSVHGALLSGRRAAFQVFNHLGCEVNKEEETTSGSRALRAEGLVLSAALLLLALTSWF